MRWRQGLRAIGLMGLLLTGCYEEISRSEPFPDLQRLADKPHKDENSPEAQFRLGDDGYAIVLKRYDGPRRQREAESLVRKLATELNVPDIWVREESGQAVVYRGRYADARGSTAQNDLRQTQMLVLDDKRPFSDASLVPLSVGSVVAYNPVDLKQVRMAGYYTLQVAFFDENAGPDYRQLAENYARELIQKGDKAFFYHGPKMSLVTVGLFDDSDILQVQQDGPAGIPIIAQAYGPRVKELQQKFPNNLGNGMTVVEKGPDGVSRTQTSFLVPVPTGELAK
ncbi:MAG: hypothetical protein IT441_02345 [Phycisphaeraceae bacterium]|nr:hypothetical protein [Phycisphaeraceae bacterium]